MSDSINLCKMMEYDGLDGKADTYLNLTAMYNLSKLAASQSMGLLASRLKDACYLTSDIMTKGRLEKLYKKHYADLANDEEYNAVIDCCLIERMALVSTIELHACLRRIPLPPPPTPPMPLPPAARPYRPHRGRR